jgi:hypothetical protein
VTKTLRIQTLYKVVSQKFPADEIFTPMFGELRE